VRQFLLQVLGTDVLADEKLHAAVPRFSMHGDDICAELVAAGCRSRVLMLTAAATMDDLVGGLGLGADDYLPKPFDFPVLVARIGALVRRAQPAIPPVLRTGDVVVDTARRRAFRGDRPLELTPKEFGVLELLLASQGRSVSAEELLERSAACAPSSGTRRSSETVAKSGYRI